MNILKAFTKSEHDNLTQIEKFIYWMELTELGVDKYDLELGDVVRKKKYKKIAPNLHKNLHLVFDQLPRLTQQDSKGLCAGVLDIRKQISEAA